MKRILAILIGLITAYGALSAQSAPDGVELTRLLKEFLAGAATNSAAAHERFWADDLIYTGSSGRRVGKAEILRDVRAAPASPAPTTVYAAEDIRIQQYGDTAVVAFRLVAKEQGKVSGEFLNSGTFLRRGGKWQVVNWQATKLPEKAAVPQRN